MSYNVIRTIATPDTMYVKLKYFNPVILSGGTSAGNIYRGNSVFDPSESGATNTQPGGFDQWALMYQNYQVLASSVKLQLTNLAVEPCRVLLVPTYSIGNPGINDGSQQPYAKLRNIGSINGNSSITIKSFMRTKKIIGRGITDLDYTATVNTNPAEQYYWHIRASSLTLNNLDLDGQVQIIYYVKFFNRQLMVDA